MNEYLDLFGTFAKVGVMTFGGGYAMLPILQREVVEHKGWATEEELMDYFAIGQCTPGVIAVNTATFVGHSRKGAAGGVVATLGLVFPCLGIIMLLPVVSLTLFHELLYRLVEQQIQATAQNRKVQEVQQDLLKVDIKWNIHGWHLPL